MLNSQLRLTSYAQIPCPEVNNISACVDWNKYMVNVALVRGSYTSSKMPCPSFAGKAAILEVETLTCLEGSGEVLCMNRSVLFLNNWAIQLDWNEWITHWCDTWHRSTIYLRGAGGFSNSSQPFSYATYPSNEVSDVTFPDSTPFAVCEDRTQKSQARYFIPYVNFFLKLYLQLLISSEHAGELLIFIFPLFVRLLQHSSSL